MINVSYIGDSPSVSSSYPSDINSDIYSIDNYGTPQASLIVSNGLEGDMEDFPSDVVQQASAAVPDQVNPGQYYNDDQQSVSIVLNNPPFRSEAVNKFLGVQQPFNPVFFFRWWSTYNVDRAGHNCSNWLIVFNFSMEFIIHKNQLDY